jgi:methyl-accepting chemotaxis protein
MLGLGIFSLIQMGNIRQAGVTIEQVSVPSIKTLDELTALNLRLRTLSYRLLLNREPATQQDTLRLLDERNAQIDRARQAYEPLIAAADEQAAFDQYGQLLNQYRQLESRMRSLSQAGAWTNCATCSTATCWPTPSRSTRSWTPGAHQHRPDPRHQRKGRQPVRRRFALVIGLLVAATVLTFACSPSC